MRRFESGKTLVSWLAVMALVGASIVVYNLVSATETVTPVPAAKKLVPMEIPVWRPFPFNPGFGNMNEHMGFGQRQSAQYQKRGDIVYLRGSVWKSTKLANFDEIGVLPVGYRPPGQVHFAVTCGFEAGDLFIRTNGEVVIRNVPFSPDTNDVSLDGVFFCTSAR